MDHRSIRMRKELLDLQRNKTSDLSIQPVDESLFHLIGTFIGPFDTPYAGGIYEVDIQIPPDYPMRPPKMKFITKVYHPNVSSTSGEISLNILQEEWSPAWLLRNMVIGVQVLLDIPNPYDPLNIDAANHYLTSKEGFNETARYWTEIYASAGQTEELVIDEVALAGLNAAHIQLFESFGFERRKVIEVLRRLNYRGSNVANITNEQVFEELLKVEEADAPEAGADLTDML